MKVFTLLLALILTPGIALADRFGEMVAKNDVEGIASELANAVDIDVRGTNGKTALMIVARTGDHGLVHRLLDKGADPNATNVNDGTPIMFAAISGNPETVALLIDAGANIDAQGSNGWNALMVSAAKGHVETTRLLLDRAADVNAVDIYLWSALHRAAYENRTAIVDLLTARDDLDINLRDDHGATALHHAAANGNREMINLLIEAGADPASLDASGRSALAYALDRGHEDLRSVLGNGDGA